MPLGVGFYGMNADDSENHEFCKFCYQKGVFTDPNMTVEEMIESSIKNMTEDLHFSPAKATELAHTFIPTLARWRQ